MIFTKSKELKYFIKDLETISKGGIPNFKHYVFCGARGTGKSLLAHRIQELLPNNVVVIDEPIDERLNMVPECSITIYTQCTPFKRGAFNLVIKRKTMDCPIIKDNSKNVKDIIKQAKKIFK